MSEHLTSTTVLKKVDQLRELNIGSQVSLPQVQSTLDNPPHCSI